MVKEIQYTSIKRVLDNLSEHPLLRDLTLEQVVRYTIRFIGLHGYPVLYSDKDADVAIHDFRGLLPCDLVSIIQVKDKETGICLRGMTDNFYLRRGGVRREGVNGDDAYSSASYRPNGHNRHDGPDGGNGDSGDSWDRLIGHNRHNRPFADGPSAGRLGRLDRTHDVEREYLPPEHRHFEELAFKTQGRVMYCSFPEGCVEVMYKSIPVDDDGFPLLIDNENYLAALEAFIKLQVFTIKFDTGKINANVLQNAQQDYAFRSAELKAEMQMPSVSEMESLSRFWNTLIVSQRSFDDGFKHVGDREYLRRH